MGAGMLGLLMGSFLNVIIVRLPKMLQIRWQHDLASLTPSDLQNSMQPTRPYNLLFPRSHCPSCEQSIAIYHNIPLLSYLWLRGRCGMCKAPISVRYPLVEIMTSLLSMAIITQLGVSASLLPALILVWGLIALSFIDAEHHLLPDDITLPLLWLGLVFNLFGLFPTPLGSAVLGAVFGYLSLWLVYWGFKSLTGQEGIGHGDFKLLALLGAWLGWEVLPFIVLIASLLGAIVGGLLIFFQKKTRHSPIPFGPFLSVGGLMALLFGEKLIQMYFKVFNI